jgi:hypothetical protein
MLYIERDVYDFERVRGEFAVMFSSSPCPARQAVGVLKRHACYWKYYCAQPLRILRCICGHCGVTHAVIPSFSLPGTSVGTEEADSYLKLREQGQGRGCAAAQVVAGRLGDTPGLPVGRGVQIYWFFAHSMYDIDPRRTYRVSASATSTS